MEVAQMTTSGEAIKTSVENPESKDAVFVPFLKKNEKVPTEIKPLRRRSIMSKITEAINSGDKKSVSEVLYGILSESTQEIPTAISKQKKLEECKKNKEKFKELLEKKRLEKEAATKELAGKIAEAKKSEAKPNKMKELLDKKRKEKEERLAKKAKMTESANEFSGLVEKLADVEKSFGLCLDTDFDPAEVDTEDGMFFDTNYKPQTFKSEADRQDFENKYQETFENWCKENNFDCNRSEDEDAPLSFWIRRKVVSEGCDCGSEDCPECAAKKKLAECDDVKKKITESVSEIRRSSAARKRLNEARQRIMEARQKRLNERGCRSIAESRDFSKEIEIMKAARLSKKAVTESKNLNESMFAYDAIICDGFCAGYLFDIEDSDDAVEFIYDSDDNNFDDEFGGGFFFGYSEDFEKFIFSKDIPDNRTFDDIAKEIKKAVPKFMEFLKENGLETSEKFEDEPSKLTVVIG